VWPSSKKKAWRSLSWIPLEGISRRHNSSMR
jgi:hypothetical protein